MERIPNEWFNTFDSYESNWNFSKSTKYTYAKNENGDAWNVILMHITTPSVPLLSFLHCDKKKNRTRFVGQRNWLKIEKQIRNIVFHLANLHTPAKGVERKRVNLILRYAKNTRTNFSVSFVFKIFFPMTELSFEFLWNSMRNVH